MQGLYLPVGIFAATAVVGLYMATRVLGGKLAPWAAGLVHAALGATGLVVLGLAWLNGGMAQFAVIALGVLVIAALGGFFLGSFHLRKVVAPKPVVAIHAGVAVIGFVLLCVAAFAPA